jgi:hypothetical protein
MIHYQLCCGQGHEFDGWFAGSVAFETQAEHNLISCPTCAGTDITRALMAPSIPRKGREITILPPEPAAPEPAKTAMALPDGVRAALQKIRAEVEKNCEYVGESFAAEARKIHHGEAEARGIYGESTPEEVEALAEDGIEIAQIPWLPRTDS